MTFTSAVVSPAFVIPITRGDHTKNDGGPIKKDVKRSREHKIKDDNQPYDALFAYGRVVV